MLIFKANLKYFILITYNKICLLMQICLENHSKANFLDFENVEVYICLGLDE